MNHDTQVIYGDTRSNKDNFRLNGYHYYKTKTGIPKKKIESGQIKASKISSSDYDLAWNRYVEIFG